MVEGSKSRELHANKLKVSQVIPVLSSEHFETIFSTKIVFDEDNTVYEYILKRINIDSFKVVNVFEGRHVIPERIHILE